MENRHIKARSKQRISTPIYRKEYVRIFKECDCEQKCKPEDCKCSKEDRESD